MRVMCELRERRNAMKVTMVAAKRNTIIMSDLVEVEGTRWKGLTDGMDRESASPGGTDGDGVGGVNSDGVSVACRVDTQLTKVYAL